MNNNQRMKRDEMPNSKIKSKNAKQIVHLTFYYIVSNVTDFEQAKLLSQERNERTENMKKKERRRKEM